MAAAPNIEMIVLRVATRCATVDEFVAAFRKWCTDTTCFIPTRDQRAVGLEVGFSLRLDDGTPVLRGLGVVLASDETSDNAYRQSGILLGIRQLTTQSEPVFRQLRLGHTNAAVSVIVAVETSGKIVASRAELADMVRPTTPMAPLFPALDDGAIPTESIGDATVPTARPQMPTILGVAPVPIPASSDLIATIRGVEPIDRDS